MIKARLIALAPIALLAACNTRAPAPGGVTPDEAQALNDAAEMLDEANQPQPGDAPKASKAK